MVRNTAVGNCLKHPGPGNNELSQCLGSREEYYAQALHWFHSTAFSIDRLCQCWGEWLEKHPNARRLKGQRVYVGDGIKVSKEEGSYAVLDAYYASATAHPDLPPLAA